MNCEYKDCKHCIKEIDKEDVCEITKNVINYDFSDNNENCIGFEYQEKCENCKNGYCKDYSDELIQKVFVKEGLGFVKNKEEFCEIFKAA